MAQTLKIDELNILRDYFSVMNLPKDEIDRRVALASDLFAFHKTFALSITAEKELGKEVNVDYYEQYLIDNYKSCLEDNNFLLNEYFEYYISLVAPIILETTINQNTSIERVFERAENDANAFGNYEYEQRMKAEGKIRKRWDTMKDERVRHTHVMADGQEVDIGKPFTVGKCQMMFPNDTSLGATADEILNCRCVAIYL